MDLARAKRDRNEGRPENEGDEHRGYRHLRDYAQRSAFHTPIVIPPYPSIGTPEDVSKKPPQFEVAAIVESRNDLEELDE